MEVIVKKWGNSAAVRIPAPILEEARFTLDQHVDVRVEDGRVVIEPVNQKTFDLDALLAGITDENRHAPVDFGQPMGRESW
ncbi:MAG: AbrB/MazE/SpoVT family DNA-binding domain-containing protein [Sulfuricella sp.]|nr:AbrB/MazE/SpoVT family DNA-binding domain-containing protein [Sulfuricella sp.]